MNNICFSLTYAKAAPDVPPIREIPIKRPPEKQYGQACARKGKPLKNKVLPCHFQVMRKTSHRVRTTEPRGRAGRRNEATPRVTRAQRLCRYRNIRGKPVQARQSSAGKTGKPRTQTPHGAFSTPLCTNLSTGLSTGKGGKQRPSCQRVKI